MVSRARDRRGPPYVSYTSWENLLDQLRVDVSPLPQRLDASVWRRLKFSGSTESALKSCLVFLGLTNADYQPNPRLDRLVSGSEEEKRRIYKALLDEKYGQVLNGISLERATRGEVREAFIRAGSGPDTAEKAVSFFVKIAQEAGQELHPHLTSRAPAMRKRTRISSGKSRAATDGENNEKTGTALSFRRDDSGETLLLDIHPALLGLLSKLPKPEEGWSLDRKEAFQRAWIATLDFLYPPTESRPSTGP
jgi:hypothetical protein